MITNCPLCNGTLLEISLDEKSLSCNSCKANGFMRFWINYNFINEQIRYSIELNINENNYRLISDSRFTETFIQEINLKQRINRYKILFKLNEFIPFKSLEESKKITNRLLKVNAFI